MLLQECMAVFVEARSQMQPATDIGRQQLLWRQRRDPFECAFAQPGGALGEFQHVRSGGTATIRWPRQGHDFKIGNTPKQGNECGVTARDIDLSTRQMQRDALSQRTKAQCVGAVGQQFHGVGDRDVRQSAAERADTAGRDRNQESRAAFRPGFPDLCRRLLRSRARTTVQIHRATAESWQDADPITNVLQQLDGRLLGLRVHHAGHAAGKQRNDPAFDIICGLGGARAC